MEFLIAVILYYLLGFLPKLRINKVNNRFHSYGMGTKIFGFIDGDKGFLAWVSIPPFLFSKPKFKASWTQILSGSVNDLPKVNSSGEKIIYSAPRKIAGVHGEIIDVYDTTNKIRKRNQQVLVLEIQLPLSGLTFFITLGTVFIVSSGRKYLRLGEGILVYSQREVKDAIGPWFIRKEAQWYKAWKKDSTDNANVNQNDLEEKDSFGIKVLGKMESIRIDDLTSITVPVREGNQKLHIPFQEYLDNYKFKEYGFRFGELSYELGYGDDVEKLRIERQRQQQASESTKTAIKNEKLQVVKRITQVNNAEANKKALEKEWEIKEKITQKMIDGETQIAGAYRAQVLSIGDKGGLVKEIVGPLIAKKIDLRETNEPAEGASNAT